MTRIKTKFNVGDEVWVAIMGKCECCKNTGIPIKPEKKIIRSHYYESAARGILYSFDNRKYIDCTHESWLHRTKEEAYSSINLDLSRPIPKLCPNCAKYIREMCHVCIMEED